LAGLLKGALMPHFLLFPAEKFQFDKNCRLMDLAGEFSLYAQSFMF
jgi:hypothetical protein